MIPIIFCLIILMFLVFTMFLIVKKIVKEVNEESKLYFTLKLQEYDELIKQREKRVKEVKIEENIKTKEPEEYKEENIIVAEDIPEYQIENLFQTVKKIEEKFNLNEEKVIKEFLKKHPEKEDTKYSELNRVYDLLNRDGSYKLVSLSSHEKEELMNSLKEEKEFIEFYKKEGEFKPIDFKNYLKSEISKYDQTVYVEVGIRNKDYNYISKRIKTKYNPNISRGIIIIYQNKKYDYSLN